MIAIDYNSAPRSSSQRTVAVSTAGEAITERVTPEVFPETKGHLPADVSTLFVFALLSTGK
jgi:hypothetical protein